MTKITANDKEKIDQRYLEKKPLYSSKFKNRIIKKNFTSKLENFLSIFQVFSV